MTSSRALVGALVSLTTLAAALVAAEAGLRLIDGQPLTSLALTARAVADPSLEEARRYVAELPVAGGVDRAWFDLSPTPPVPPPDDPSLTARRADYEKLGLPSWYDWNRAYLIDVACRRRVDFDAVYAGHSGLFTFDAAGEFPTFRFLRRAAYPSGLVTNDFGFRSQNVTLDKPAGTIRIAFVGASTTVGFHSATSYPEYVGHWLNAWAAVNGRDIRFEIINAGREGINSNSIAAIVRQELLPFEPDLVVYYEGANQFWPASFVEWPDGPMPERPRLDPRKAWDGERYSALLARVRPLWDGFVGKRAEDERPHLPVNWPVDLDEDDPPLDHPQMPLNLPVILRDLDTMRQDLAAGGGELVLSSFFWMVQEGMKLDPVRNGNVLHYLHRVYWPFDYTHIARLARFQNRVFRRFASERDIEFVDFAAAFPADADLFADAIHMTPGGGTRLQGWVMLQQILPIITRRIEDGRLPRTDREPLASHPAFAGDPRRFEPVPSLLEGCPR